jgi:hypothetical protein
MLREPFLVSDFPFYSSQNSRVSKFRVISVSEPRLSYPRFRILEFNRRVKAPVVFKDVFFELTFFSKLLSRVNLPRTVHSNVQIRRVVTYCDHTQANGEENPFEFGNILLVVVTFFESFYFLPKVGNLRVDIDAFKFIQ